jgi:NADPH-dependent 2,4-dienoyl-CoA reductase/sulfur reductase-like enzyme
MMPPALFGLPLYEVRVQRGSVQIRKPLSPAVQVQLCQASGTILIVGSGAAGTAAAIELRRGGFDGRLIMVTAESVAPYDRTLLSKGYLSADFERRSVFFGHERYFQDLKIDILMGRQVTQIDPGNRHIIFMDEDFLHYDKLLVATGGIPLSPGIPGTELRNFFLLRNLDDADAVRAVLGEADTALIMGAGFIGLETAAMLRQRGLKVHVAAPEKVPLCGVFGELVGKRLRRLHQGKGVHFHPNVEVKRILGDGVVQRVELSDASALNVDMILAGIGIVPAVHLFEDSGIVEKGAVPVDGCMRTRVEDIYAAGDIALMTDAETGKPRRVEHWAEAIQQGRHAARCMIGSQEPYRGMPFFRSRQYDSVIRFAGYIPKVRKIVYRGDAEAGEFLAGYFRGKRLRAVAGIGREEEFRALFRRPDAWHAIRPRDFRNRALDIGKHLEQSH